MIEVAVLAGSHGGQVCAPVIAERLAVSGRANPTLLDDLTIVETADFGGRFDVCVYYGENSTPKRDFSDAGEAALRAFVRGGKGLVGVHVASYRAEGRLDDLIGGHSPTAIMPPKEGPKFKIQWQFPLRIVDRSHPVTRGLEDFELFDEHYVSYVRPSARVLLEAISASGTQPMAWVQEYGAGRVFHTPLGHRADDFGHPTFWRLLLQATAWVARLG